MSHAVTHCISVLYHNVDTPAVHTRPFSITLYICQYVCCSPDLMGSRNSPLSLGCCSTQLQIRRLLALMATSRPFTDLTQPVASRPRIVQTPQPFFQYNTPLSTGSTPSQLALLGTKRCVVSVGRGNTQIHKKGVLCTTFAAFFSTRIYSR